MTKRIRYAILEKSLGLLWCVCVYMCNPSFSHKNLMGKGSCFAIAAFSICESFCETHLVSETFFVEHRFFSAMFLKQKMKAQPVVPGRFDCGLAL